jgi:hypothetical protein
VVADFMAGSCANDEIYERRYMYKICVLFFSRGTIANAWSPIPDVAGDNRNMNPTIKD